MQQQIKEDILINPSGNTGNNTGGSYAVSIPWLSVKDPQFGAVGNGAVDDWNAIQSAITYCITHDIRALFVPKGTYSISKPLYIGATDSAGNHQPVTLEFFGESSMWTTNGGSDIKPAFTDTFALGIQRGKGCVIRNLSFKGKFTPPSGADYYTYFNTPFDSFTDGVCRDSRYSPYAGIVIDPFSNGQLPSDGGYPRMTSYYSGANGVGGSTGNIIKDVEIFQFVVGVCSCPNGFTRNGEITTIENIRFLALKLCVSGGQDQEKANRIINFGAWGGIHTVFATSHYGANSVGHWDIDTGNIAGQVIRLIDNGEAGYYPTHIKNIFAESVGTFGTIGNYGGRLATHIQNCMFNFEHPASHGMQDILIDSVGNVVFDSCTFRFYGTNVPIRIKGDATYNNCSFGGMPILCGLYQYPQFINCVAEAMVLGLIGPRHHSGARVYLNGDWTLNNYLNTSYVNTGNGYTFYNTVSYKGLDLYITFTETLNVTIDTRTASFTSPDSSMYAVNAMVELDNSIYGIITDITGNVVTVSFLLTGLSSKSYIIKVFYPLLFTGVFMGNITSGSNKITHCQGHAWFGGVSVEGYVGTIIKNPYGGSRYLKITGLVIESDGSQSLTVFGSITTTQNDVVFGNYDKQEIATGTPDVEYRQANYILRRGDKVILQKGSENSIEYLVTKGGLTDNNQVRHATLQIAY